jgi:hypothetical protein
MKTAIPKIGAGAELSLFPEWMVGVHPSVVLSRRRGKRYRLRHIEKDRARKKKWALANPEKRKASWTAWSKRNREYMNAFSRRYYHENPEYRAAQRARAQAKRDKFLAMGLTSKGTPRKVPA